MKTEKLARGRIVDPAVLFVSYTGVRQIREEETTAVQQQLQHTDVRQRRREEITAMTKQQQQQQQQQQQHHHHRTGVRQMRKEETTAMQIRVTLFWSLLLFPIEPPWTESRTFLRRMLASAPNARRRASLKFKRNSRIFSFFLSFVFFFFSLFPFFFHSFF